jgi:protein-tyrosine phosphatase
MNKKTCKILFVCLGNICRSPMAEGVMKRLVDSAGRTDEFFIDSAGMMAYHQGELPDSRMRAHAARRGYSLTHRSRPVTSDDFERFDLIVGMDDSNIAALQERAPSAADLKKICRMTDYCTLFTDADHVPDPYYGGASGFEYVIDLLEDACAGLLNSFHAMKQR